jgi:peptidyl-prolyl cis-trans isomerase A (cyclophilin A)
MRLGAIYHVCVRLGLAALLLCTINPVLAQNGIFADFTTSKGNFTCQLDFTNAPKTVANFVGLATGERPWLDLVTGRARSDAFYDGLTFHRVVTNFVIQAGSPNGMGTDGPGYAVTDEFSQALVFTNAGVLAMANSGTNSGGSQFFITVVPFVSGNNVYPIFGHVTSGMSVVSNIDHVVTDANNKPLTNVVIQQVSIRRVGTAAQAFDVNAYSLAVVTNVPVWISRNGLDSAVTFSNRLYADNRFYSATNLSGPWTSNSLGIEITAPTTNTVHQTNSAAQQFFRVAQVQYASSTLAPKNVLGRRVVVSFSNGGGTVTNNFNSSGGGTYTSSAGSGTITSYTWTQEPFRGFLWPIYYSGLNPMTLQLNFSRVTGGIVSGTIYRFPPLNVSGTFTLGP